MSRDDKKSGLGSGTGGAGRPAPDGVDPDILARADALIAAMQDDYLTWAEEDLATLFAALESLEGETPDPAAVKAEVFRIAHDMKGQGGSFGYPLITAVGNRLCRFLERAGDPMTPEQRAVARAHAETLHTILSNRIQGEAGQTGTEMLARLDGLRDAALT
jgi:chemotaxis protein histidine kinase CheA